MYDLTEFEERIGYTFRNRTFLETALIHSSYINEHEMDRSGCNERIEFLGDAVLELLSSEFLYRRYPDIQEGELTRLRASLVCEPALAYDAKAIDLSRYLCLGKGEDQNGGRYRDSIVSDAMEAVIGAIYLDGGLEAAEQFVQTFILNDAEQKQICHDAKSALQEYVQDGAENAPEYRITGSSGPDHQKTFFAEVLIGDTVMGRGEGRTKKAAENDAAMQALRTLKGNRSACI